MNLDGYDWIFGEAVGAQLSFKGYGEFVGVLHRYVVLFYCIGPSFVLLYLSMLDLLLLTRFLYICLFSWGVLGVFERTANFCLVSWQGVW